MLRRRWSKAKGRLVQREMLRRCSRAMWAGRAKGVPAVWRVRADDDDDGGDDDDDDDDADDDYDK